MAGVYNLQSKWDLRTNGGHAFGKSIGAMGLSVQGGMRKISLVAHVWNQGAHMMSEISLEMSLVGMQVSVEKGFDLIESLTGVSVSRVRTESYGTPLLVNSKNPTDLKSTDFAGPCSIVSFDLGKVSAGVELKKFRGGTYMFLGQGTTVVDQSPNWLERVVGRASGRSTLGGAVVEFNRDNGIFSNARAACSLEINEAALAGKIENSVAIFSGNIVVKDARTVRAARAS